MAAPLPHRSGALQSTLGISLGAHVVLVILIALTSRRAPAAVVVVQVEPIELDGSDLSAMDSGKVGREDRAQGAPATGKDQTSPLSPPPTEAARDPEPPPTPDPPTKPADLAKPEAPPKPAVPPPPGPATDVEPPPPPPAATPPAKPHEERPTLPKRPRTPRSPASASPDGTSSSDVSAPSPPGSGDALPGDPPGDEGGPVRAAAKDLVATFVHELPLASDALKAWRTLPVGDVGETTVQMQTGDDGRLAGDSTFAEKNPLEVLVEMVTRTRGRLRTPMAIDGKTAGPGAVKLKLRVRLESVPIPDDIQGTFYNLASSFHGDHGDVAFSLPEGRRITISIDVVSRSPR